MDNPTIIAKQDEDHQVININFLLKNPPGETQRYRAPAARGPPIQVNINIIERAQPLPFNSGKKQHIPALTAAPEKEIMVGRFWVTDSMKQSKYLRSLLGHDKKSSFFRLAEFYNDNGDRDRKGSGVAGHSDGLASNASFNSPSGIASDSIGNLYICDTGNNAIRRINETGYVSTLAGSASEPASFMDGQGSDARFNAPVGIAFDSSTGFLYITDRNNSLIRQLAPNGTVSTVAGNINLQTGSSDGQSISASFNNPYGIAADYSQNLYVSDTGNNLIRKINASRYTSTYAGVTSSPRKTSDSLTFVLSTPLALAIDKSGNLFIVNSGSGQIIKIDPFQTVSTFFNNTASAVVVAIAVDPNGNLWVAQTSPVSSSQSQSQNQSIVQISPQGTVTDVSSALPALQVTSNSDPSSTASLSGACLAFSPSGNLIASNPSSNVLVSLAVTVVIVSPDSSSSLVLTNPFGPLTSTTSSSTTTTTTSTTTSTFPTLAATSAALVSSSYQKASSSLLITSSYTLQTSEIATLATSSISIIPSTKSASPLAATFTTASLSSTSTGSSSSSVPYSSIAPSISGSTDGVVNFVYHLSSSVALQSSSTILTTSTATKISIPSSTSPSSSSAPALVSQSSVSPTNAQVTSFIAPVPTTTSTTSPTSIVATSSSLVSSSPTSSSPVLTTKQSTTFTTTAKISTVQLSTSSITSTTTASTRIAVADMTNNQIRVIDTSTNQVTTLAGSVFGWTDGYGTSAQIAGPMAVAATTTGLLVVANAWSQTICKINVTSTLVTTIAGTGYTGGYVNGIGSASLVNTPQGITVALSGLVVFSDSNNQVIRVINVTTMNTTFLAGSLQSTGFVDGVGSAAKFNGSLGLATSSSTGLVYIVDNGNSAIRILNVNSANVTTLPSPNGAIFNSPRNVAVLPNGCLGVSDSFNNVYRMVNLTTGLVTTLAGSGSVFYQDGSLATASFYYPYGIAVSSTGQIAVCDYFDNRVRSIDMQVDRVSEIAGYGGLKDGIGSEAIFFQPWSVAYDPSGLLVVMDTMNYAVRSVNLTTFSTTTLAGSGYWGSIDGIGVAAQFNHPSFLTMSGGYYFLVDAYNVCIRRITPSEGKVSTFAGSGALSYSDGTGSGASFNAPQGIATLSSGTLVLADGGNFRIRLIDQNSAVVTTVAGSSQGYRDGIGSSALFNWPAGVAVTSKDLVLVIELAGRVRMLNITTRNVTTLAGDGTYGYADGIGIAAQFNYPQSIAVTSNNLVLVSDYNNNVIRAINMTTANVTTVAGSLSRTAGGADGVGTDALFNAPYGLITVGELVYLADMFNNAIRTINTTNWNVTTQIGRIFQQNSNGVGVNAGFNNPTSLAFF